MNAPVNAAYGRNDVPKEDPRAITVLGVRVPGSRAWMVTAGLIALLVMITTIILIQLPSGLPFLAAKNADGFVGYVGFYIAYMLGFVVVLGVFGALLALLATSVRGAIPLLS